MQSVFDVVIFAEEQNMRIIFLIIFHRFSSVNTFPPKMFVLCSVANISISVSDVIQIEVFLFC